MNAHPDDFSGRLNEVRDRIAAAAARSGRPSQAITLIAVIKTVPLDCVRQALEAGVTDVGENRVQEAASVIAALGRGTARWHLIGRLQRNKSGRALELFDRIHTLDSLDLAQRLSSLATQRGRPLEALVQVNVSGEATKSGISPQALVPMLEQLREMPGLVVDGLMAIGAPVARPELARREFIGLRELRDAAERAMGVALPQLSMGMSGDYEIAVEEGSTMVRVGTALFGARPAPDR